MTATRAGTQGIRKSCGSRIGPSQNGRAYSDRQLRAAVAVDSPVAVYVCSASVSGDNGVPRESQVTSGRFELQDALRMPAYIQVRLFNLKDLCVSDALLRLKQASPNQQHPQEALLIKVQMRYVVCPYRYQFAKHSWVRNSNGPRCSASRKPKRVIRGLLRSTVYNRTPYIIRKQKTSIGLHLTPRFVLFRNPRTNLLVTPDRNSLLRT